MKTEAKQRLISQLESDGFNFSRNVYQLSISELADFREMAKQFGYKGTKTHSLGFSFYIHLQKLNAK